MNEPARIGLFGGTFDPIHLGHLHLATAARDALNLDQVRFIPCQISPHKFGRSTSSAQDRIDMLKAATRHLPWAVIDDQEILRDGPSYSYLTADAVASRFPNAQLHWILGGDQWKALPTWKNIDHLAKTVNFIILARDGEIPDPRENMIYQIVPGDHPASATAIRESFANGATDHPWLPPGVAPIILERGLYQKPI